jgi:prepilin-type N-terminal cleavage/methylation domain-containing protein
MREDEGRRDDRTGGTEVGPSFRPSVLPSSSRRRAAFTLIEVLVVVFIALLVSGLAAPSFTRSLKAQRIRTSARTVVTAHKYARNMAVLRQQPMAVLFDRIGQVVEVVAVVDRSGLAGRGGFLEERSRAIREQPKAEDAHDPLAGEGPPPAKMESIDLRPLATDVRIVDFKSDGDFFHRDGVYWVNYYPSGMSDGFVLRLEDARTTFATITADPISGGAEVKFDDE